MHCQYIASNEEARYNGALNKLFYDLVNEIKNDYDYFDFGIANENNGRDLNEGLASWKQRMGGRAMPHDFYSIDLNNASKIISL